MQSCFPTSVNILSDNKNMPTKIYKMNDRKYAIMFEWIEYFHTDDAVDKKNKKDIFITAIEI